MKSIEPIQPDCESTPTRFPKRAAWVHKDATANPGPQPSQRDARDTAAGCRDRATADLLQALTMSTGNGRLVLEHSAASWTVRAELLQRIETGIETRSTTPTPAAIELTAAEITEDAAFLRL